MKKNKKIKFAVRAAALVIYKDKVLLVKHRKGKEEYWVLPGGHVEAHETILAAARRELKEELNISPRVEKILFFDEVFLARRRKHVIDFVFLARARTQKFDVNIAEAVVDAKFFSFSELKKIDLRPPVAGILTLLKKRGFKANEFFAGVFCE